MFSTTLLAMLLEVFLSEGQNYMKNTMFVTILGGLIGIVIVVQWSRSIRQFDNRDVTYQFLKKINR